MPKSETSKNEHKKFIPSSHILSLACILPGLRSACSSHILFRTPSPTNINCRNHKPPRVFLSSARWHCLQVLRRTTGQISPVMKSDQHKGLCLVRQPQFGPCIVEKVCQKFSVHYYSSVRLETIFTSNFVNIYFADLVICTQVDIHSVVLTLVRHKRWPTRYRAPRSSCELVITYSTSHLPHLLYIISIMI